MSSLILINVMHGVEKVDLTTYVIYLYIVQCHTYNVAYLIKKMEIESNSSCMCYFVTYCTISGQFGIVPPIDTSILFQVNQRTVFSYILSSLKMVRLIMLLYLTKKGKQMHPCLWSLAELRIILLLGQPLTGLVFLNILILIFQALS